MLGAQCCILEPAPVKRDALGIMYFCASAIMHISRQAVCVPALIILLPLAAVGQPARDSGAVANPAWRDSARYGGGPSVGPPPSDYTGAVPPAAWCLQTTGQASGDFGGAWTTTSRSWLRQVLSDTTRFGAVWRRVLGGAPQITTADSIVQITDESTCRAIAETLNREVLGWRVGPPPVVVFRVRDHLLAYPSNATRGEWGLAVGMTLRREIRGVALW